MPELDKKRASHHGFRLEKWTRLFSAFKAKISVLKIIRSSSDLVIVLGMSFFLGYGLEDFLFSSFLQKDTLIQRKHEYDRYLVQVANSPGTIDQVQSSLRTLLFEARDSETRFQIHNVLRKLATMREEKKLRYPRGETISRETREKSNISPSISLTSDISLALVRPISRSYEYMDE